MEYNMNEIRKEKSSGKSVEMSMLSGGRNKSDKSRGKKGERTGDVKIGTRMISLIDRDDDDAQDRGDYEVPTRQYQGNNDRDYMKPKQKQTPAFVKPETKAATSRLQ